MRRSIRGRLMLAGSLGALSLTLAALPVGPRATWYVLGANVALADDDGGDEGGKSGGDGGGHGGGKSGGHDGGSSSSSSESGRDHGGSQGGGSGGSGSTSRDDGEDDEGADSGGRGGSATAGEAEDGAAGAAQERASEPGDGTDDSDTSSVDRLVTRLSDQGSPVGRSVQSVGPDLDEQQERDLIANGWKSDD